MLISRRSGVGVMATELTSEPARDVPETGKLRVGRRCEHGCPLPQETDQQFASPMLIPKPHSTSPFRVAYPFRILSGRSPTWYRLSDLPLRDLALRDLALSCRKLLINGLATIAFEKFRKARSRDPLRNGMSRKRRRIDARSSPFRSAEYFEIEEIIDPRATRSNLCRWINFAVRTLSPGPVSFSYRP